MKKFVEWLKGPKSDFLLLIIVIILANLVGANAFFRWDLTSSKSYSLSQSSKEVVKNLEEPLSVKVFFSENLPAPYNTTEQYLKDILVEYKGAANKNFSYEFLDMTKPENESMARSYKIQQKQIQEVKDNEVGFKNVYMGLVLVYADSIETLDGIISPDGLEYKITSTINKMINTTSSLAGLKDNVKVTLYLSRDLAPFGISGFKDVEPMVQDAVAAVNKKNMNRITFQIVDPSQDEIESLCSQYGFSAIEWTNSEATDPSEQNGKGLISLVMEYKDNFRVLPVGLTRSFFGSYGVAGLEGLEDAMSENLQSLVSRSDKIGYLTGFGTRALDDQSGEGARFNLLTKDKYEILPLDLENEEIPSSISNIIIAGPRERISDEVFYKLDQFLMRGGNLSVFADTYKEVPSQNPYELPQYELLDTGLPEFLANYGITLNNDYVMDINCYKTMQRGIGELPMYYVPLTERNSINQKNPITKNLSYVLMFQNSSLEFTQPENADLDETVLIKTSPKSWLMKDNIIMHPMYITPPSEDEMETHKLALLIEGKFNSGYETNPFEESEFEKGEDLSSGTSSHLTKAVQPGKIFVTGSSVITTPMLIDDYASQPVSIFVRNVLDYMNGNEDLCTMRTKGLPLNTLKNTSPVSIKVAKAFNMYGVPLLVLIIGLIIWRMRVQHRRAIRVQYGSTDERETMSAELPEKKSKKSKKSEKTDRSDKENDQ